MTQKQLRDIAAYWGTPCTYDNSLLKKVGFYLLGCLQSNIELGYAPLFKLHLRPISSLTDEEIRVVIEQVEAQKGELSDKRIFRQDTEIRVGVDGLLRIHFDGEIEYLRHYSCHTAPIYAYLQSIGVYVPGTVDDEFVEVTP